MGVGKLEPFRASDLSNGIYADGSDPLGRVWYHIPNLGPKFCDAVRKYSIIANFREAHVIARKRSKESECMWVGIVGDPAAYTTGSKRHLIEFMMRNPGLNVDQSNRRQQSRMRSSKNSNPLKKRRRKRRRLPFTSSRSESSEGSSLDTLQRARVAENKESGADAHASGATTLDHSRQSGSDDESSQLSTTPSIISMDRQGSGQYGFNVREPANASSPVFLPVQPRPRLFHLPHSAVQTMSNTGDYYRRDWFDPVYNDPLLRIMREPPIPSPDSGKVLILSELDDASPRQLSPVLRTQRKYSVEDLNELLMQSGE